MNNGVLRKNEFEKVQQNLRDKLGLHVVAVDATDRFLNKLTGVTDPEKKRKIIGNEFIGSSTRKPTGSRRQKVKSTGWCRERFIPT